MSLWRAWFVSGLAWLAVWQRWTSSSYCNITISLIGEDDSLGLLSHTVVMLFWLACTLADIHYNIIGSHSHAAEHISWMEESSNLTASLPFPSCSLDKALASALVLPGLYDGEIKCRECSQRSQRSMASGIQLCCGKYICQCTVVRFHFKLLPIQMIVAFIWRSPLQSQNSSLWAKLFMSNSFLSLKVIL